MLEDWCVRRCLKLHVVHVMSLPAVQLHLVVMDSVVYGSVKGVCGSNIASVVPIRAMASLSISPVDLLISVIFVWRVMAVFVRVMSRRLCRRVLVVMVPGVMLVASCVRDTVDCKSVASTSDAIRRVRSNR